MKLLRKNFYGSQKNLSKTIVNSFKKDGDSADLTLANTPVLAGDICNEDETVINSHIALELNENTFHLSPSEINFRYEQFEHEFKNKNVPILSKLFTSF
jgi:hypothetical protein